MRTDNRMLQRILASTYNVQVGAASALIAAGVAAAGEGACKALGVVDTDMMQMAKRGFVGQLVVATWVGVSQLAPEPTLRPVRGCAEIAGTVALGALIINLLQPIPAADVTTRSIQIVSYTLQHFPLQEVVKQSVRVAFMWLPVMALGKISMQEQSHAAAMQQLRQELAPPPPYSSGT